MPSTTSNYSFQIPTVGGDADAWGGYINTTITSIDTLLGGVNNTEFEILDGATITTAELNYSSGVTSAIQTQLNTKAAIASPTFTGTPAAPTASTGTNTTQVATTAFVQTEVTALVDSAPGTLNTLNELAAALGDDASFSTTVTNSIATKLPLAGGTMTGALVVNNTLDIEEVYEKVTTATTVGGTTFVIDTTASAIHYFTANATANPGLDFQNVNANMAIGQSLTLSVLLTNGSTPYYFDLFKVDSTTLTPKWAGGSAPSAGNASSIDTYTFTIIKTANATFTVLASLTQFA